MYLQKDIFFSSYAYLQDNAFDCNENTFEVQGFIIIFKLHNSSCLST